MIKRFVQIIFSILMLPIMYLVGSLITSYITVNNHFNHNLTLPHIVYLHTNGVHLDIAIDIKDIPSHNLNGLYLETGNKFISFGWGEENFYLNTPEWKDLTIKNGFNALFVKSPSLMHITRYNEKQPDWVPIHVTEETHQKLMNEIAKTFKTHENGEVIILPNISYGNQDEFYRAHGSYHVFYTCNTWVNQMFKNSGIKACFWTPFDFPLIQHHQDQ